VPRGGGELFGVGSRYIPIDFHAPGTLYANEIWQLWFDEATRDKIQIQSKDTNPLLNLINKENLPKEYGGDLDWKFEDEPNLDEDARRVLEKSMTDKGGVTTNVMPRGPTVFARGRVWSAKEYLEQGLSLEALVQQAGGEAGTTIIDEKQKPVSDSAGDSAPVPVVNGTA
jgi:hypothetical protein